MLLRDVRKARPFIQKLYLQNKDRTVESKRVLRASLEKTKFSLGALLFNVQGEFTDAYVRRTKRSLKETVVFPLSREVTLKRDTVT